MTTHDRDKIIAAAKECGMHENWNESDWYSVSPYQLERFYTIAFEAGRKAEQEEIVKDLLPPIATPQTKAHYIANEIAYALCEAIRARGDSK